MDRDASPYVAKNWCSQRKGARFLCPLQTGITKGGEFHPGFQRHAFGMARRLEAGWPAFAANAGKRRDRSGAEEACVCYSEVRVGLPRRTLDGIRPTVVSGIEWAADAEAWFVEDVGVDLGGADVGVMVR